MFDYRAKPFNLDDEDVAWVEKTFSEMTEDEKIQSLFFPCMRNYDEASIDELLDTLHPCGVMYRPCSAEEAVNATNMFRKKCKIPMLIAANLEKGGNGIVNEGTLIGAPLQIAATDNVENARRLGILCAREGKAVGANYAFAPIIDIDYNFRNPITNTRTFGSDPARVAAFGAAYTEECQKLGVCVSIKHFPGDGRDERDQHLVTSINDMSCEDWMATYGNNYKASIDKGALTVMVGHIMQPAWQKRINPDLKDEDIMPATLSPELIGPEGLLRKYLGFNGVICTDATTMAGFTIPMDRSKSVPYSIACGADIFLFNKNMEEDLEYMRKGVADGVITKERLDEAVKRVLALKAALKLYKQTEDLKVEDALAVLGCEEHQQWAKEVADQAVTLVKEEKGVLPLDPVHKKRVLYCPIESEQGVSYSVKAGVCDHFKQLLEKEGFEVTTFVPAPMFEGKTPRQDEVTKGYDYIIYLANMSTKSNQTTVRIEWQQPMGANCPHYVNSVPTIFISVENPYHLLDVPRVKTFINAYNSNDYVLDAIIDKIMGRSEFKGKNPVDPFCGKWDTRL
ncbi:MAG TPA: glycoside hydrolase family 3 protein [Candidatus Faecivivens stercoravium]|uniref:beta-N-acetylhexosaminidase n=1 Tax=Candidatus Faecivivens stercoravium TaxID=2840803 RepID=A0A9D1J4M0_9FIRM|nr:glycoside hydrolase family 3 protein [Candidatus Faecivivens stercoravium]